MDTLLRIEKGDAAPEELAALTAILLARAPHSWQG
ncbi:acyl-CoA carboxylase epsilon subunit [Streptomyces sp. MB09-01]|nr:acyl-CoA carboxylase epsilon subunit [Streptomyces sp. MB09-01]